MILVRGATPNGLKAYTGFTGGFLTGQDLDGEGAALPLTINWTGINISGLTNLVFSADFAEFFDSPGDIDALDSLIVEAQIDGQLFFPVLEFTPGSFTSPANGGSNGVFENGPITLGNAASKHFREHCWNGQPCWTSASRSILMQEMKTSPSTTCVLTAFPPFRNQVCHWRSPHWQRCWPGESATCSWHPRQRMTAVKLIADNATDRFLGSTQVPQYRRSTAARFDRTRVG